jgi:hypothetical protein
MVVFGYFYPHFQLQPIVLKQLALILGLAHLAALDFEVGGAKNAPITSACRGPNGRFPHAQVLDLLDITAERNAGPATAGPALDVRPIRTVATTGTLARRTCGYKPVRDRRSAAVSPGPNRTIEQGCRQSRNMSKRYAGWGPSLQAGHRGEIAGWQTRRAGGGRGGGRMWGRAVPTPIPRAQPSRPRKLDGISPSSPAGQPGCARGRAHSRLCR